MISPVDLELGGRQLKLVLSWGAFVAFERLSGKNTLSNWTWASLTASDTMFLVYATANRWRFENGVQVLNGPENVGLDELAGELLTLPNLDHVQEALQSLYNEAYPEEGEEEGESAPAGEDPPLGSPGTVS